MMTDTVADSGQPENVGYYWSKGTPRLQLQLWGILFVLRVCALALSSTGGSSAEKQKMRGRDV
jgi:hypothetical protein